MNNKQIIRARNNMWAKYDMRPRIDLDPADLTAIQRPAEVCAVIRQCEELAKEASGRVNAIAIITDGSGLFSSPSPAASLPVLEGLAFLYKTVGGVEPLPLCLDTQDTEEIVKVVSTLGKSFSGVSIEGVAVPKCFEIKARLEAKLNMPVLLGGIEGLAVASLAALNNALRFIGKEKSRIKIIVSQDTADLAELMTLSGYAPKTAYGTYLETELKDADVFIGCGSLLTPDIVTTMKDKPVIFDMTGRLSEEIRELTENTGIVAGDHEIYKNRINSVLAFPGIFRGALDCGASRITNSMKLAAASALEAVAKLGAGAILPPIFERRAMGAVAMAVYDDVLRTGNLRC